VQVHSLLPERHDERLSRALGAAVEHVPQSSPDAALAAGAGAFVGPWLSADVAEAMETFSDRLVHVAPAATWVGLTRRDEPGSDDAPRGRVLRVAARDTVVCRALVAAVPEARVVHDGTEYGRQIAAQLRMCGLREGGARVVYAGLGRQAPELPPDPICLEGAVEGDFPHRHPDALYFAAAYPEDGFTDEQAWDFAPQVELAGRLLVAGDPERHFDEHGDLLEPRTGVWRFVDGRPVAVRP
jgi:hypothetical protein